VEILLVELAQHASHVRRVPSDAVALYELSQLAGERSVAVRHDDGAARHGEGKDRGKDLRDARVVRPDPERRVLDLGLELFGVRLARLVHHGGVADHISQVALELAPTRPAALADKPAAAHPHVVVQPGDAPQACVERKQVSNGAQSARRRGAVHVWRRRTVCAPGACARVRGTCA